MTGDTQTTSEGTRPPTRKELLADNSTFIRIVGELLHTFRNTADKSCCLCGTPQGAQHKAGRVCLRLANWRHSTQYKSK